MTVPPFWPDDATRMFKKLEREYDISRRRLRVGLYSVKIGGFYTKLLAQSVDPFAALQRVQQLAPVLVPWSRHGHYRILVRDEWANVYMQEYAPANGRPRTTKWRGAPADCNDIIAAEVAWSRLAS